MYPSIVGCFQTILNTSCSVKNDIIHMLAAHCKNNVVVLTTKWLPCMVADKLEETVIMRGFI